MNEMIEQVIVDTMAKEQHRNNPDRPDKHKYSEVCSCGHCHMAHLIVLALLSMKEEVKGKAEAILEAIRITEVGSDIILHNNDKSIWCILTVKCKEHPESKEDDGGRICQK